MNNSTLSCECSKHILGAVRT